MKPSISIVTSLYKSENYILEFYSRVHVQLEKLGVEYEIIFVEDGVTDKARAVVEKISEENQNVKFVELSKNFGHQYAMLAGIRKAKLDTVFTLDVDLEEPPELISEFYELLVKNWDYADTVVGIHKTRKSRSIQRITGAVFYRFFQSLSDLKIEPNQLWLRIMKRSYVDAFLKHDEYLRFAAGLFSITGFNQIYVPVEKTYKGSSSYSMFKRITSAIDALTSFTTKPLKLLFFLGTIGFLVSLILVITLIISKIFIDFYSGWISLTTLVLFFGSLNLMAIGVVGIYVSSIYLEVKSRPKYIIKNEFPAD